MIISYIINASYSTSDLESKTETTQVTTVAVAVDDQRNTENMYTIGNPVYASLSTDSESKFTRDNKVPSTTGQQSQPHTQSHAIESHSNNPNMTECEVENPSCVQKHLQTESELESDNIGINESQQTSGSTTNISNKQPGVDVTGQGSSVEKAVQIQIEIEPDRKQPSIGYVIEEGHLSGTTKFNQSIGSTDFEEQTTVSQFTTNDLIENSESAATFSFREDYPVKADINNTTLDTSVHIAKATTSDQIIYAQRIESDTIKERESSMVNSVEQYSHGDTNFSEAETVNFTTLIEPIEQQLDIMSTNGTDADMQGIESSCSQTQYSNADNTEFKNVQSFTSRLEDLTQSYADELCSSIPFPSKAELHSEMCTSNNSAELGTREQSKVQHLDKSNISEFSHEIKDREEVEKPSNSEEEDAILLHSEVKQLSDQLACFSTDSEGSTKRELVAITQISSPITHHAHLQEASTPPAEIFPYGNVGASLTVESSYTLPSSNTNSQTARTSFSNSCNIHDYEEIPDFQPNPGALPMQAGIAPAMTWPQEQPTSMDKDKDKLDVGVAHVLASLHSCLATPREEDMDEIHPAKVKKHSLKGKLYKLYRRKPSAQLKGLQNSTLPSNEEEGISLQSVLPTLEKSQPVLSTQETVSVKEPSINRFEFKYKLHKPIHRTKDLISKSRQVADHNDSQKVHPVCSAQVDMVTKRKQPSAKKSESREGLDISIRTHESLPPKTLLQEPTLTSSKGDRDSEHNDTSLSLKEHGSSSIASRPVEIASRPVEQNQPSHSSDTEISPHHSNLITHNQRELVPLMKKQVTIQRSKSEEKIHENRYGSDSINTDQLSKNGNDSSSHKLHLSNPMSYGTLPTRKKQPSTKLTKEELRRQYRHRSPPPNYPLAASYKEDIFVITSPSNESEGMCQSDTISAILTEEELRTQYGHSPPPPNNPLASPLASNKEDNLLITSPSDESEDIICHAQSDTISVVHDYEEIDLEVFPAKASAATQKLKSKEELRKLYRHRAPPKVPTVSDTKEDILSDVQQTKATTSSEDPHHSEHSDSMAHKPQELAPKLEGIIPSEKVLLHLQSSSGSTEIIPDTIKEDEDERVDISTEQLDHCIQEGHNVDQPHESPAESSSSHALPASDSENDYMPLIPKRKKKKASSDYETLRF